MNPNYEIHIADLGEHFPNTAMKFDFVITLPETVEVANASCGCTEFSCDKVGQLKQGGNTYPNYRFKGTVNVGVPKKFKDPNFKETKKEFSKSITVFFDSNKHKVIRLKYTILTNEQKEDGVPENTKVQ